MRTDPLQCLQLKTRREGEARVGAARWRERGKPEEWRFSAAREKQSFKKKERINNGKYCKQVKGNAGKKKYSSGLEGREMSNCKWSDRQVRKEVVKGVTR